MYLVTSPTNVIAAKMQGKTSDTTFQFLRADSNTHVLEVLDYAHHEIHDGGSFIATYAADISIGNTLQMLIIAPDANDTTKEMHLVAEIICESETDIKFYENTTSTASGTSVAAINKRRTGTPPTAFATIFHTPAVTVAGTLLFHQHIGSGKGGSAQIGSREEWNLKTEETPVKYYLLCTATAAGWISVALLWYEHTPKTA